MKKLIYVAVATLMLVSCQGEVETPSPSTSETSINNPTFAIRNYSLSVNSGTEIIPIGQTEPGDFHYEYDDTNLSIWQNKIYVHKSNTTTTVKAIAKDGSFFEFNVASPVDTYESSERAEQEENWLAPINFADVNRNAKAMPRGLDVSTAAAIYRAGGQFYNEHGEAEDLFRILKRHGSNYVRLRLWNDPYNHTSAGKVTYGGGVCDLDHVLEMAFLAKQAGLEIYLVFHYSDFWADPGKQVIPKQWAHIETAGEMAEAIYTYTRETIETLKSHNLTPKIVSLGNETTRGMLVHMPGPTNENLVGEPHYTSRKGEAPSAIRGNFGSQNYYDYIDAANRAVKDVDPSIQTMVHTERHIINRSKQIIDHYNFLEGIPFDIIGLSAYPYYQGTPDNFSQGLKLISETFPDKLITLAETSYGFTFAPHQHLGAIFNASSMRGDYPVSVAGQARLLDELFAAINSIHNGYGLFYWEGAYIPYPGVGWADASTKNSWANQALFTYDGHVLPSLRVFELWEA